MRIYGFGEDDCPELNAAAVLDPLPEPLEACFSSLTNIPSDAQQILNSGVAAALADWARRYPLKTFQRHPVFGQLVVMFSPRGVYIASMGTMIPEAVEEMTRLGVALIKAQSASPSSFGPPVTF